MEKYQCKLCLKIFSLKGNYTTHLNRKTPCNTFKKVETGEKEKCQYCSNEYSNKYNKMRHESTCFRRPQIDGNSAKIKALETIIESDISLPVGKYVVNEAGMGCHNFYRRNKTTLSLEMFFMHSDSWGQYGEDTSDGPQLNAFLHGYSVI